MAQIWELPRLVRNGEGVEKAIKRCKGFLRYVVHITLAPSLLQDRMSDNTSPEKAFEGTSEHLNTAESDSSVAPSYQGSKEERIQHERQQNAVTGKWAIFSKLGNLPEWKVRGSLLRGKALNWSIGFVASCGFLMFGYDQGVLSALLTLDSFQENQILMTPRERANNLCWLDNPTNTVPDPNNCTGDANTQAAGVAIYQIGCWMGSLVILFYGEIWGRKSSTFWGSSIMIVGTIMQAASFEYGLFVGGRIVSGVGNGMVTASMYMDRFLSEKTRLTRRN